jgi:hypothetical protein
VTNKSVTSSKENRLSVTDADWQQPVSPAKQNTTKNYCWSKCTSNSEQKKPSDSSSRKNWKTNANTTNRKEHTWK